MKAGQEPAFPVQHLDEASYWGMTLRDWFAGQALTGRLVPPPVEGETPTTCAEDCYEVADAMLIAREQAKVKS